MTIGVSKILDKVIIIWYNQKQAWIVQTIIMLILIIQYNHKEVKKIPLKTILAL